MKRMKIVNHIKLKIQKLDPAEIMITLKSLKLQDIPTNSSMPFS